MKGKAALVVGMAAGYVLGTRDGRERYEQIKSQADRLWNDPKVQKNVAQASDVVKEKAPVVQSKVSDVAQKATSKVKGSDSSSSDTDLTVDTAVVPPTTTSSVPSSTTSSPSTPPPVPPASPSTTSFPSDQKLPGDLDG
jgi:hypothetical protein